MHLAEVVIREVKSHSRLFSRFLLNALVSRPGPWVIRVGAPRSHETFAFQSLKIFKKFCRVFFGVLPQKGYSLHGHAKWGSPAPPPVFLLIRLPAFSKRLQPFLGCAPPMSTLACYRRGVIRKPPPWGTGRRRLGKRRQAVVPKTLVF